MRMEGGGQDSSMEGSAILGWVKTALSSCYPSHSVMHNMFPPTRELMGRVTGLRFSPIFKKFKDFGSSEIFGDFRRFLF